MAPSTLLLVNVLADNYSVICTIIVIGDVYVCFAKCLLLHSIPQLKCCKATCEVVNVYDLYTCSHCLGKAFSQHYSMINATW